MAREPKLPIAFQHEGACVGERESLEVDRRRVGETCSADRDDQKQDPAHCGADEYSL